MQLPEITRFDVEALTTPDAIHWSGFFWFWNDVLEREWLFRQLPDPADFRPNSMRTNLQPEYLSEESLAILEDMVAEMQRLGEKGYDIRDVLPAIFQDDETTAQVRQRRHDLLVVDTAAAPPLAALADHDPDQLAVAALEHRLAPHAQQPPGVVAGAAVQRGVLVEHRRLLWLAGASVSGWPSLW